MVYLPRPDLRDYDLGQSHDDAARKSIILRQPLVDLRSESDAAIYLQRIARKLALSEDRAQVARAVSPGQSR